MPEVSTVKTNPVSWRGLSLTALLAFFAIYFVWGSTYLAIRIAVEHLPPLFAAGVRFFAAGGALYIFAQLKAKTWPTRRQWRNLAGLSVIMFSINYAALFWAEKYVPSGIASVIVATIPLWTILFETVLVRKERFRLQLLLSIVMGFCGVAIVMLHKGENKLLLLPCLVILCGSFCWSLGSVLSRTVDLPASKPLIAGAEMMIGGFLLLLASAFAGDMHTFPRFTAYAAMALLYLILFGSLLAYTAYVWLLGHMSATRVASYAYVNPVVAVAIGHWAGAEPVSLRTILGTALVLFSVVLTLRSKPAAKAN